MNESISPRTIAAIATPPGRGGIGIVRVSGSDLGGLIQGIAGRTLVPRLATATTFRDAKGAPIDFGIALFFPAPNSYTGEDVIEISCHGSPLRRVSRPTIIPRGPCAREAIGGPAIDGDGQHERPPFSVRAGRRSPRRLNNSRNWW